MHVDGFSLVPREHPPQEDLKAHTAFFFLFLLNKLFGSFVIV